MLRPSSEMAVAITVRSLPVKPNWPASARPCWRAVTMSASERMATRVSDGNVELDSIATALALPGLPGQQGETFFEAQLGRHAFQAQPHLHNGKGNAGLDADHHGLHAGQPGHVGNAAP